MKDIINWMKYFYKYKYYKNRLKKSLKIIDELTKDNEFLINENSILKSRLRAKKRVKKNN